MDIVFTLKKRSSLAYKQAIDKPSTGTHALNQTEAFAIIRQKR